MKLARRDFVASLETGLSVIEAFDAKHQRLTLSEVAHRANLTRAAARRYLLTLTKLGYADYDGKYFGLDLRVLRLGYGYLASAPLPLKAQPVIDSVAWQIDAIVSLAVLDDGAAVYVARSRARQVFVPAIGVGTRLPAYCSAAGRMLLAYWNETDVALRLDHMELVPYTSHTKTDVPDILASIRAARHDGYACCDEECELGLRAIAVPVPRPGGRPDVVMTVSVQAGRMTLPQMTEAFLPALLEGAETLSALL